MPLPLTPEEFLARREAYSYPAVGLKGCIEAWEEVSFSSTWQMDRHHNELLMSGENSKRVFGYLSTVFWGHYSGQDGIIRAARAQSRATLALNGTDRRHKSKIQRIKGVREEGVDDVAGKIRTAVDLVESDRCGEALWLLCELPQLGFAFASKVCAFLAPAKCGVIDSVIAGRYLQFVFEVDDKGNVKKTTFNRKQYDSYCSFLQEKAEKLNLKGEEFLWKDRDNIRQSWRAVDVERALF